MDPSQLTDGLAGLLRGVIVSVLLILIAAPLGAVLSVMGAAARRSRNPLLARLAEAYVELIRNTPFLVQLFFIFFGLPSLGMRLSAGVAAVLAMTLNLSAYGTEIVRAGLDAVPAGQAEAGAALGLTRLRVFVSIVLPQALRIIFPALGSQMIITMLESAVVSQIAVPDLTYQADMLQARTFRAFETYALVAGLYLALALALRRVLSGAARAVLGPSGRA